MAGKIVVAEIVSDATSSNLIKIGSGATLDLAGSAGSTVLPTIPVSKMPTGSVLQVLTNTLTSAATTTTSTMAALGLSRAITPSSTSSKIHVLVTGGNAKTADDVGTIFTIYRGSTALHTGGDGMVVLYGASTGVTGLSWAMQKLDSPSTTSAVTYSVYWRTRDNGNTSKNHWLGGETTITLMEIAG